MRSRFFASTLLLALWSCGPVDSAAERDPLIIGALDWRDVSTLEGSARANSRAVGYLSLPARGTRCTAFVIAPDVIMTNHHCVPEASSARGATFDPTREAGVAYADRVRFACETRLGADEDLDYALLACEGRPGDAFGVVELDARAASRGDGVYVVQQNCDYYRNPGCTPNKVVAYGALTEVGSRLSHDADTLGGSSGSPVFDAARHVVVGLHNAGVGNDGEGRGDINRAVPMSRIVPALRARHPGLELGGRAPSEGPTGLEADALEPNDGMDTASSFTGHSGLTIHAGDQDVFELRLDERSAVSVRVRFSHALGDLDAELRQGGLTGPLVVTSASGDDDEVFEAAGLEPGVYYLRVYGYQAATNRYDLEVTVGADPDRAPAPSEPAEPSDSTEPFEPNDDRAQAPVFALPFSMQSNLRIADGADVDYFAFDARGAEVVVTLTFVHASGDLDLAIEDADGRIVASSAGVEDVESIAATFAPGRYFARVSGYAGATGAYGLSMR